MVLIMLSELEKGSKMRHNTFSITVLRQPSGPPEEQQKLINFLPPPLTELKLMRLLLEKL